MSNIVGDFFVGNFSNCKFVVEGEWMFEVYKPSGRFGFSTFIYFLIGLVVTALLAVVYAYGLRYIPFIYISVLMAGAFGVALGFLGSLIVDM